MQITSYIITLISIVGTVANAFQKRWCFVVWLFTNLFWVIYDVWLGAYGQAVLYVVNCITCVIGLWRWNKKKIVRYDIFDERQWKTRKYRKIRKVISNDATGEKTILEFESYGKGPDKEIYRLFD